MEIRTPTKTICLPEGFPFCRCEFKNYSGWIYCIQVLGVPNLFKIGHTVMPMNILQARIKEFKQLCKTECCTLFTSSSADAKSLERLIHNTFKRQRVAETVSTRYMKRASRELFWLENEDFCSLYTLTEPTQPSYSYPINVAAMSRVVYFLDNSLEHLSNHEIVGKKPGFAEERIRRTVAAIQDYNAGIELAEQIAVNKGSLRTLSAASVTTVNKWADEHAAELEAYATAQGHGFRQNVGKDLLPLVPLAWNRKT